MKFLLAMQWKCQSFIHCLTCNWMKQYASLFVCRRAETTLFFCLCRTSFYLLPWNSWLTKSYAILVWFLSINFLQHIMAFYRVYLSFHSNAEQYLQIGCHHLQNHCVFAVYGHRHATLDAMEISIWTAFLITLRMVSHVLANFYLASVVTKFLFVVWYNFLCCQIVNEFSVLFHRTVH